MEHSIAMSPVEIESRGSKRSISSTIVGFFKNPIASSWSAGRGSRGEDAVVKKQQQAAGPSGDSAGVGSVILYDSEVPDARPPVLPILPIQRLRLLRQKQYWRQRIEFNGLPVRSSSMPVAAANTALQLQTLQLQKLTAAKRAKATGTVWSGDFEYDLSEYDLLQDKKKDVSTERGEVSATGCVDLIRVKKSDDLPKTQKNLLVKGLVNSEEPVATATVKVTLPKVLANKNKTVLPTIGFDFIKENDSTAIGNDTPSKKFSLPTLKDKVSAPYEKTPSFTFGTVKIDSIPSALLTGDVPSNTSTIGFTFGAKTGETSTFTKRGSNDSNDDDNGLRRKKRFHTSKETSNNPSACFSFGTKPVEEEIPAVKPTILFDAGKVNADVKPAFSFDAAPVTEPKGTEKALTFVPVSFAKKESPVSSEILEANAPSFIFGATASKTEEKKNALTKPTFSFGATSTNPEEKAANAPFSFGVGANKFVGQKESTTTSSFTFGVADAKVAPSTTPTNTAASIPVPESTASEIENKSPKPFSFGLAKPSNPSSGFSFAANTAGSGVNSLLSSNATSGTAAPSSGFQFEKNSLLASNPTTLFGSGSTTSAPTIGNETPSVFGFGTGAGATTSTSSATNTITNPNAASMGVPAAPFAFSAGSGGSVNVSNTAFGSGFGSGSAFSSGSNTPSLGLPNTSISVSTITPKATAFNPSSQINMSFGGTNNINPANIFSGSTSQPQGFGSFNQGNNNSNNNGMMMNSSSNISNMVGGVQPPIQRKLARMRQTRR